MKFSIVIASLLGVFLAPALANHNMENNLNGQPSENSNHPEIRLSSNPKDGSEPWKTIWDFKAGYVATKVFSKNTCIIATTSKRFWLGKHLPTPPPGEILEGYDEVTHSFSRMNSPNYRSLSSQQSCSIPLIMLVPPLDFLQQLQGLGPYQLPPRENRFIISRNRLQSLSPYGKRIQALCRGIPSYLAYPAPGSNFLRGSNFSSGSNFLERDIS